MFNEINHLAFLFALTCPQVKMVNRTTEPWTDFDRKSMVRAQAHCREHHPNAPCLKMFRKFNTRAYTALCGRPE